MVFRRGACCHRYIVGCQKRQRIGLLGIISIGLIGQRQGIGARSEETYGVTIRPIVRVDSRRMSAGRRGHGSTAVNEEP